MLATCAIRCSGSANFAQALTKQFDDCIYVRIIQSFCEQASMPGAHVFSRIGDRTSEYHGQKCLLLGDLVIHVDIVEKGTDTIVGEDLAVEDVNSGVNRGLSTQLFV